jgi:adhesin/invasin
MVTRTLWRASLCVVLGAVAVAAAACDKMPLVAPTGTVITLFANNTVLPVDGSIEITAIAIEGGAAPSTGTGTGTGTSTGAGATAAQGTPVHNGTVLSFTTTLGRIEPQEARTHNGQVTVRLFAAGASGVATVRAFSGGAASNELKMSVGAAAAKTVFISSTPQTLASSGGTAQISARVVDVNGTNLAGVPVTFSADNGTLSTSTALTDANGIATITLTTSRETKVTVTVSGEVKAEVTVKVNPRIGLTITPPSTSPTAGLASNFTVAVASTANVQNVRVDWGDGSSTNLGALSGSTSVPHTYRSEGTFDVSATATDASGETATQSTSVNVLPQQPPSVTVTASDSNPNTGEIVTLTASVSGASSTVQSYQWDLGGACATPATATTTSNRQSVSWSCVGTKSITVTVTQSSGPVGIGQTAVNVIP